MTKHTSGPWFFNSMGCYIQVAPKESVSPYDKVEAICSIHKLPSYKANARLIAAAPELLEALKHALLHLEEKPRELWRDEVIELANAAIAKAEGK